MPARLANATPTGTSVGKARSTGRAADGQSVVLAFADRRLFAAVVLTIRGGLATKVEAIADPAARAGV
jgi:hypothetical protein